MVISSSCKGAAKSSDFSSAATLISPAFNALTWTLYVATLPGSSVGRGGDVNVCPASVASVASYLPNTWNCSVGLTAT